MRHYRDSLTMLVDQGVQHGFVTFQQVNAYLPDVGGSPQMLDGLILALEEAGLDLIEEPDHPREDRECAPAGLVEIPHETGSSAVRSSDPVRMYLSEMADIPLLKRDREIYLAKKIEGR